MKYDSHPRVAGLIRRNSPITQSDRPDLSNKFCPNPFDNFEPTSEGMVSLCCLSWLPHYVGDMKTETMDEAFNSPDAQEIRRSILDGDFKHCDHRVCAFIQNGSLIDKDKVKNLRHLDIIENHKTYIPHPTYINFLHDESCNLSCPSCRVVKINHLSGEEYEFRKAIDTKILSHMFEQMTQNPYEQVLFNLTGSGDPFASKMYRDFLFSLDGSKYPSLIINLQTNGIMLTPKVWDKMSKLHKNLSTILISLDAAKEETYNVVRRGGWWKLLLQNIEFLSKKRKEGKFFMLRLDFVVQQKNYKEMRAFIELAKSYNLEGLVDRVYFSIITNWGTYTNEEFAKEAIWMVDHPEHSEFLSILKDPIFKSSFVDMGNLSCYL